MITITSLNDREIVYVLEATGVSGGVKNVFEHVNHLHDMGYRVHLFSLDNQPSWFPLKVKVRKFRNYRQMVQILKKMDAIKVATWWNTVETVVSSCDPRQNGKGIPFYLVQDIEESYYPNSPIMREKVLQTYQKNINYLTVADWTTNQLAQRFDKQATNISIAIDHDNFKPNRTHDYDPYRILACSRKRQHLKGYHITEAAVKKVYQKLRKVSLVTFGPESSNIKRIPTLHFSVPDDSTVAYLYANCGVFVQTSYHEGFGMPILEAMACGAPIVTTRANGNEEFCMNEQNCLMVNSGDVDGVANAIYRVLTDKELSNYLTANALQTAQKYNWPRVMSNLTSGFNAY